MKKNSVVWILSLSGGLLLLLMTSVTKSPDLTGPNTEQNTQINLALREIADQLLKQNQDVFSPIPPIQQEAAGTYLITLGTQVDYFQIRTVIDAILERHQIRPDYRLSLLNCQGGEVVLGFLAYAHDEDKAVPCQERIQTANCYHIRLALVDQSGQVITAQMKAPPTRQLRWWLMGLAICFPLLWMTWQQTSKPMPMAASAPNGWLEQTACTSFHPTNQTLQIHNQPVSLTFREAKLLNFFFENANQVLERERILQAVWEDEGIIVGRSLDVFVSRLRKKLKPDPGIQLINVHGVGYKLEVGYEGKLGS